MTLPPRPSRVEVFNQNLLPMTATVVFTTAAGEQPFIVSTAMLRVYGKLFIDSANKIEAEAPKK